MPECNKGRGGFKGSMIKVTYHNALKGIDNAETKQGKSIEPGDNNGKEFVESNEGENSSKRSTSRNTGSKNILREVLHKSMFRNTWSKGRRRHTLSENPGSMTMNETSDPYTESPFYPILSAKQAGLFDPNKHREATAWIRKRCRRVVLPKGRNLEGNVFVDCSTHMDDTSSASRTFYYNRETPCETGNLTYAAGQIENEDEEESERNINYQK